MKAIYYNPSQEATVDIAIESIDDFKRLAEKAQSLDRRVNPALQLVSNHDSSVLTVALSNDRAVLSWRNEREEYLHTERSQPGEMFVFDYFGSYSEVPPEFTVSIDDALSAVQRYMQTGIPEGEDLIFVPD